MPLPTQLSRLSARSVYSRNMQAPKTQEEPVMEKRGRGRPRKYPLQAEVKVLKKAKNRVSAKKAKFAAVKRGRRKIEENSSEADCSSSENSSEDEENESESSEEVVNEENKKRSKNKSTNNKEIDEDLASEDEEDEQNITKKSNKQKKVIVTEENEEEEEEEEEEADDDDEIDEEEEDDNEEGGDNSAEDDDNVLYSFADRKATTPAKKKRKLMVEKKKLESKEKKIKMSHSNPSSSKKIQHNKNEKSSKKPDRENINGNDDESSFSHNSFNEVDVDDDLSSNDFPLNNINNQFSTGIGSQINSLQELMDSSTSRSRIASYVERNRTAECGNYAAQEAFQWMISPINHKVFFDAIFERQPYHVTRKNPLYYHGLFSCNDLEIMLKENNLVYEQHIDVLKYENFERVTTSLKEKALYSNVWDDYKEGYSVRVRNPQKYNKNLWNFCSLLQEYLSSVTGVNVYLTPPNSQGFPPHYDDIDAFIVQTGGSKKWKIYAPRNRNENLARYPSRDFEQDEIGNPMLQVILQAGDFLYIPRGYIHQAETQDDYSLHLTFSSNQLNTWGDLIVEALGKAVDHSILNEIDMRKSLPKDYTDYVGTAVSNMNFSPQRTKFIKEFYRLCKRALTYVSADEGADIHALKVLSASLPPVLNKMEKSHSIHGNGSHWVDGRVKQVQYPKLNTKIQLLRRRNIRLVVEENIGKVYHTFENDRDPRPLPYHGSEVDHAFVEINMDEVPAFVFLLKHSPNFVAVHNLPINKKSDKLSFARTLYESGLLMTEEPLEYQKEDQSCFTSYEG